MYNNPYMNYYNNGFNQQSMTDRIDNQIAQLNQMKEQLKNSQPTAINQTFQLAPNSHGGIKYADTMEDVAKEQVFIDTPFFSKDMSVLWVKDSKGNIKTYELKEIIPKDDKDVLIEGLQFQIAQLREELKQNAKSNDTNADGTVESEKPEYVSTNTKFSKKQK